MEVEVWGVQRFNFFFSASVWIEYLYRLQGALPTANPLTSNTLLGKSSSVY